MILTPGITSVIKHVFIQDSSVTTGAGKTGLLYSGVTAYYVRAGIAAHALTMETIATLGTWASSGNDYLGLKEVDATNLPGIYEIDLPNNILAAGANQVTIQFKGTGIAPCNIEIQLANTPSNITAILGTALTETVGGYLAAAFKKLFDIASPVFTAASVNQTGDSYNVVKSGGAGDNAVIKTQTDKLAFSVANQVDANVIDWKGATAPAMTGDAYARLGAAGAGLTAIGDTRIANLDAAVSTRAPEAAGNVAAIKAKTDNLPANPAIEGNVQGHVADALAVYDPPTKAELEAAVSPLALEAGIEAHVLAVLNSYDPPTRAEATADKTAILAAVAALNDITVGEILSGDLSDSLSLPANSLADLVRKLFWVLCNRLAIIDATGAFTAYKGDGVTPGATGTIVDNGTNTVRSAPTWP